MTKILWDLSKVDLGMQDLVLASGQVATCLVSEVRMTPYVKEGDQVRLATPKEALPIKANVQTGRHMMAKRDSRDLRLIRMQGDAIALGRMILDQLFIGGQSCA